MADGSATSGLMPRSTIAQLVGARLQAQQAFAEAWDAMKRALDLAASAAPSGRWDMPWIGAGTRYGNHVIDFSDGEKFADYTQNALNRSVWSHVIRSTNLDQLMDRQEREAFDAALRDNPPEATVENIAATVERLISESDTILKRGIAAVFSTLDRRFRSHDGFKIGSRLVLSSAISEFGTWNHYRKQDDNLIDIERVFARIDGEEQPSRDGGIVGAINSGRQRGFGPQAYEVSSPYFRAKVYKNGNVHLWFTRNDLVEKVNLLLAAYYGANLGASADAAEADVKHDYALTPAKNFGLFPSPPPVVARVIEEGAIWQPVARQYAPLRVLEPSAGPGAIALVAAERGHSVTCVEIQPQLAANLSSSGRYKRVVHADFLTLRGSDFDGKFDRILMNPPFDRGRDIDHVTHALNFLEDGGVLVSVMSAGTEFREDAKASAFRKRVESLGGYFRDLPPGSFSEAGTNVNTLLCVVGKRTA